MTKHSKIVGGKTPKDWQEEMKGVPCYRPAPPFYDFCNRAGNPARGQNCEECTEAHCLRDYIE